VLSVRASPPRRDLSSAVSRRFHTSKYQVSVYADRIRREAIPALCHGQGSVETTLSRSARPDDQYEDAACHVWRINGQQIRTSRAQLAAYAILLARTAGGRRHKGMTHFLLPMDSPGITIRPLAHRNEVFLDEVFMPDELVGTGGRRRPAG
jgi:alkylation response protein AidB-like acyl-CoA dehydrogenase